jgi:hypothetical protein
LQHVPEKQHYQYEWGHVILSYDEGRVFVRPKPSREPKPFAVLAIAKKGQLRLADVETACRRAFGVHSVRAVMTERKIELSTQWAVRNYSEAQELVETFMQALDEHMMAKRKKQDEATRGAAKHRRYVNKH